MRTADKQIADIEDTIQRHPDGIISIPVDGTATAATYKKVSEAGIKLVFMDNVPPGLKHPEQYAAMVSADSQGNGWIAAQILAFEGGALPPKPNVTASFSGSTLSVTASTGGKSISFSQTITYPSGTLSSLSSFSPSTKRTPCFRAGFRGAAADDADGGGDVTGDGVIEVGTTDETAVGALAGMSGMLAAGDGADTASIRKGEGDALYS